MVKMKNKAQDQDTTYP